MRVSKGTFPYAGNANLASFALLYVTKVALSFFSCLAGEAERSQTHCKKGKNNKNRHISQTCSQQTLQRGEHLNSIHSTMWEQY
jgi:hypothetical protein